MSKENIIKKTSSKKLESVVEEQLESYVDIEAIEKEFTKKGHFPLQEKVKVNAKIIPNIWIQIAYIVYILFIILGMSNIENSVFIVDLKVFSILFLAIAIIIIEKAYQKNNDSIALYGIEVLFLAIFNLSFIYAFYKHIHYFSHFVFVVVSIVNIYYFIKSILKVLKCKKEYVRENSEMKV